MVCEGVLSDLIHCEIRFTEDESRQSPGRLTGTLLTYETRANDRPELFAYGALTWPDTGIIINEQHNRQAPILRTVPFVQGNAVMVDAELPNTTRGRDAATNVREGVLTGLSVEFYAMREGRRDGMREIRQATVRSAGLVDSPSYSDSVVAVRHELHVSIRPSELTLWL